MSARAIYPPGWAEKMKDHAGEPYQPSNGDEGEHFMGTWCAKCTRDNLDPDTGDGGCPIIAHSMILNPGDADYPKEFVYRADGQPSCTGFDERISDADRNTREARAKAQQAYDALPRDPKSGRPVI